MHFERTLQATGEMQGFFSWSLVRPEDLLQYFYTKIALILSSTLRVLLICHICVGLD